MSVGGPVGQKGSEMIRAESGSRGGATGPVRYVLVGLGLLGLGWAGPASADWAEDFDAGFSQSWTFATVDDIGDPPDTGVSAFDIIEAGANDYLRISHSTTAFRDGGGGATDGFGYVSESFADAAIEAVINAAPLDGQQSLLGVIGRGDVLAGSAYVAGVDFANSFFAIGRSDDFFDFLSPVAVDFTVSIDPSRAYRVQFFLLGSNLVARLIDQSTGELLSTITGIDFLYSSGVAGILVETEYDSNDFPVAPIVGTFDDVSAVPEPSFAFLIAFGVLGLASLSVANRSKRCDREAAMTR